MHSKLKGNIGQNTVVLAKNIRYFKDFTNIEKILRDYTHNIQNG